MRVRALGVAGGEVPGRGLTSFLVDERLALDAGHLTASLTLDAQAALDAILLSHAHLDHVKDVAFLADNLMGLRIIPPRRRRPGGVDDPHPLLNDVIPPTSRGSTQARSCAWSRSRRQGAIWRIHGGPIGIT
jgi:phosphoribosyl 1,2-cyclic phosphodiesterase